MEFFLKAKNVRLRSHHDKYLAANHDEESICQDSDGSSPPQLVPRVGAHEGWVPGPAQDEVWEFPTCKRWTLALEELHHP
ncbi:hypothetical protein MLD38_037757 [Melastoma candidum]|uniref:Uncharacterized protein n=1 Tax=Melastoma candidum TaxID=119954 RepID=A0ACB9LNY9_9MYRT|nr:hypothetical protein MLD38_037757 [Melastoma candidum]